MRPLGGAFGVILGVMLVTCCNNFGVMLGHLGFFGDHVGVMLG